MKRWLLLIGLLAAGSAWGITPGLYYDPDHDGHGFDLQPVGLQWVLVLYSYGEDGQPEWMLGVATAEGDRLSGSLDRFDYDADRSPAQRSVGQAGTFVVDFEAEYQGPPTGKPIMIHVASNEDDVRRPTAVEVADWLRGFADVRGIEIDEDMVTVQKAALEAQIEGESTALYATGRVWDDGIIHPRDTRVVLGIALRRCHRPGRLPLCYAAPRNWGR